MKTNSQVWVHLTNTHHTICTQHAIPLLPYTHIIVTSLTIYTHIARYHSHTCTHLECMPWPWVWGCSVGPLLSPPLPPAKGERTRVYQECRGWGLTPLLLAVASESLFQAVEHLRTAEREWSTREREKASGSAMNNTLYVGVYLALFKPLSTISRSYCNTLALVKGFWFSYS